MKKLILFILLLINSIGYSQIIKCITDELVNSLIRSDYNAQVKLDAIDNYFTNNSSLARTENLPMINIPVVVYIIHDNQPLGVGSNITDSQVQSQLTALNNYFNPYGINFCLGTKLGNNPIPSGQGVQNTPGIIHYNSTPHAIHTANSAGMQNLNNLISINQTNRNQFLRIWVVKSINDIGNSGGTVLGYSMFPNVSPIFDGVVIRSDVFGNGSSNLIPDYNLGKVLVHEIGHYFGLYHTFHEGCSGMSSGECLTNGDRVCDTPPVSSPNYTCTIGTDSCIEPISNLPDLINNYMDYGDNNCTTDFTPGQVQRMLEIINLTRNELISDHNLIYTGVTCVNPNLLTAKFTPTSYSSCFAGNSITFNPLQSGLNYSWNFGDPNSGTNNISNLANPTHSFSSANNTPYTVTLTVSNGPNSAVFSANIYISNCSTVIGLDSNWYTSTSNAINFSSGVPVVSNITLPLAPAPHNSGTFAESCAFQSDSNGNILFYTNGLCVYNSSHNIVNSTNLKGHPSSKAGALIVPNPAVNNQYYVFVKDAFYGTPTNLGLNGFTYSLVNANGTTISMSSTNLPVTTPSGYLTGNSGAILGGEGITASQKCDGYWLVTTLKKSTGNFIVVYSLNSSGLIFNSEIQLPITDIADCYSSLKFSPDGNKIIFVNYDEFRKNYLYDFDKFTGVLSNRIEIPHPSYGVSFSPDSKLLYLDSGGGSRSIPIESSVFQYNLMSNNIPNTKKTVGITSGYTGDIQIGPDSKLYECFYNKGKIAVLHNPNLLVSESNPNACNFTFDGIISNTLTHSGMPNIIDSKLNTAYNNTISYFPTNCLNYKFFPNACETTFIWDFGDITSGINNTSTLTTPSHIFSGNGTYTVTLKNNSNVVIATTTITIGVSTTPILGSDTICTIASGGSRTTNNSISLLSGQTVIWNITSGTGTISGANNQSDVTINWASSGGIISATITNASGCTNTMTKIITETEVNCFSSCPDYLTFNTTEIATTADYKANISIVTSTNYIVNSGSTINLKSGGIIVLETNSYIKNGALFLATLEDCEGNELVNRSIANNQSYKSQYYSTIQRGETNNTEIKNENSVEKIISIYPNPSSSSVTITSTKIKFKSIIIASIEGRKVYSEQLKETMSHQIDISSFPTGIYIISMQDNNGQTFTEKLIKN